MHPVIIIGGGPVGLSAAIDLASKGIKSVLIEKHPSTTTHPKARGVNGRTMELFRLWDIENQLTPYQLPYKAHGFTWLESLQGKEITRVQATIDYSQYSPTQSSIIAQDIVEQELFKKALNSPLIDLRFNTERTHTFQDSEKVTVEVINRETNEKETLTSQYLIAADGANSPLRKELNIEMDGLDNLGTFCNIFCEINIDKYVKERPSACFMFTRPDLMGTFILSKEDQRKWLVGTRLGLPNHLTKEQFTDDYSIDFVKKVVGDPEVEVRLINKAFWTMAALIAKKYRVGRIFLAGDAAHRLPPTGGFGMNTGIQDVHNLAWKLEMVINKKAKDTLLDTYFTERSQIAKTNIDWSLSNSKRFEKIFRALAEKDFKTFKEALEDQTHHINNILLDLGFIYGFEYQTQKEYKPTPTVGARTPHIWLQDGREKKSTLDLYKDQFVLVCDPLAYHWQEQFSKFPCQVVTIGNKGDYQNPSHDFLEKYEISNQGAVLVRPDGHVAWRSKDECDQIPQFSWL